jgi:uncharacterized repeat protein (TIGR01451 family)
VAKHTIIMVVLLLAGGTLLWQVQPGKVGAQGPATPAETPTQWLIAPAPAGRGGADLIATGHPVAAAPDKPPVQTSTAAPPGNPPIAQSRPTLADAVNVRSGEGATANGVSLVTKKPPPADPVQTPPDLPPSDSVRLVGTTTPGTGERAEVVPPNRELPPMVHEGAPMLTPTMNQGAALGAGNGLIVEKMAPAVVPFGKPVTYEIVVRNAGTLAAQHVVLEEQLSPGVGVVSTEPAAEARGGNLAWLLGTLAPGAKMSFHVTVQPPADGDLVTSAVVTSATICQMRARVVRSGLSLTVTATPRVPVGGKVAFRIAIVNNMATPVRGLRLQVQIPEGLQHEAGKLIEAKLPDLAPGEARAVPLEVTAVRPGTMVSLTSVAAQGIEPIVTQTNMEVTEATAAVGETRVLPKPPPFPPGEDRTRNDTAPTIAPTLPGTGDPRPGAIPPGLDLLPAPPAIPPRKVELPAPEGASTVKMDVVDADKALEVGGETTYEIRVRNEGAAATHDLLVHAELPDGMTLVSAEGPTPRLVDGRQITFQALGQLGAKQQAVYHVSVKALKPGDARFKAFLHSGPEQRPVSSELSTRVYAG